MRLRRVISFAAAAWFTVSCAAGRYASGPYDSEIKSIRSCDGTVEVVNYPSSEPALTEKRMVVYLPPDYYTDTLRNYPVLYLLHGARGNEVTWFEHPEERIAMGPKYAESMDAYDIHKSIESLIDMFHKACSA